MNFHRCDDGDDAIACGMNYGTESLTTGKVLWCDSDQTQMSGRLPWQ